jgi:hypothetical protein
MTLSELITQLEACKEKNGDLQVYTATKGPGGGAPDPKEGLQGRLYDIPAISKLYYDYRNPELYAIVLL